MNYFKKTNSNIVTLRMMSLLTEKNKIKKMIKVVDSNEIQHDTLTLLIVLQILVESWLDVKELDCLDDALCSITRTILFKFDEIQRWFREQFGGECSPFSLLLLLRVAHLITQEETSENENKYFTNPVVYKTKRLRWKQTPPLYARMIIVGTFVFIRCSVFFMERFTDTSYYYYKLCRYLTIGVENRGKDQG